MMVNNGSDFDALIPLRVQMFKSILMNTVQIMSTRQKAFQQKAKLLHEEQWKLRLGCTVQLKTKLIQKTSRSIFIQEVICTLLNIKSKTCSASFFDVQDKTELLSLDLRI